MNKSELFKQAHNITKETLKHEEGVYSDVFAISLKNLYSEIKEEKRVIVSQATRQKEMAPHIFTKTIEEMTKKQLNSPYLIGTASFAALKKVSSIAKAAKEYEAKEYAYYKKTGGHVTMC